jgi:hypothetical protein
MKRREYKKLMKLLKPYRIKKTKELSEFEDDA